MQRYLIVDYETRGEPDLKKTGAYEYVQPPSTKMLCVAWRLGTKETLKNAKTKVWSPALPSPYGELITALCDPGVTLVAHNAMFEQLVTRFVLSRIVNKPELKSIPPARWICTSSLASAMALPRKLSEACAALGLEAQKDMEGHRLMLKMSKPRKPTKHDARVWHQNKSDLLRLMEYCAKDVDAETELFLKLPPLHPRERDVWELDQKINWRGFHVDRPLVATALNLIEEETEALDAETKELTFGLVRSTTQRAAVLSFIQDHGAFLPDLTAKTVADALNEGVVSGKPRRLLEIRQAVSRASTAKYEAFEARSRSDSRVRDNFLYHGASTGRWSGAGVQAQNLPQGKVKDVTNAVAALSTGDLEWVRTLYGNPMEVLSSCLRPVIMASPGKELFCADFNAIETRVLFWIARHETGLNAYRENRDLYKEMAAYIFGKPASEVTKAERDLAKRAVLGCGYGMGYRKFKETCRVQGNMEISEELAQVAVQTYRKVHHPVVKLWSNMEKAALLAAKGGKRITVNRVAWFRDKEYLYCELPSGRRLSYYGPEIKYEPTPWEEKRPVLYHYGVNSMTKKWESSGTYGGRLTENVIQAVASDALREGMLAHEAAGYEIILHAHDEVAAEKNIGEGNLKQFETLMATNPKWAEGLPLRVEGWVGERYRK